MTAAPMFATLWFVPHRFREVADRVTAQALDVPTACTHIPAFMVCIHHPQDGVLCGECIWSHVGELVLADECALCGGEGANHLGPVPSGDNEVIMRWCGSCTRRPKKDQEASDEGRRMTS